MKKKIFYFFLNSHWKLSIANLFFIHHMYGAIFQDIDHIANTDLILADKNIYSIERDPDYPPFYLQFLFHKMEQLSLDELSHFELDLYKNISTDTLLFPYLSTAFSILNQQQFNSILKKLNELRNIKENKRIIDISFPDYWDAQKENILIVPLPRDSDEFKLVSSDFLKNVMKYGVEIDRIERLQNQNLFTWYAFKKIEIETKETNKGNANEKWLYFPITIKNIQIHHQEGINPKRMKQRRAIFSVNADLPLQQNIPIEEKAILYCRVLTGTSQPYMPLPVPSHVAGTLILEDSSYVETNQGASYIIFEQHQSYPEYIIHLKIDKNKFSIFQQQFQSTNPPNASFGSIRQPQNSQTFIQSNSNQNIQGNINAQQLQQLNAYLQTNMQYLNKNSEQNQMLQQQSANSFNLNNFQNINN